jgi:hypothetical protein
MQTSVYIKLNHSLDLDSTRFGTLGVDFDRAHGLPHKVKEQSRITYPVLYTLRFIFALTG